MATTNGACPNELENRMRDDVHRLRLALQPVAEEAKTLSWYAERPWTTDTHVDWLQGLPAIDLHALSVKTALHAAERACEIGPELQAASIYLVTGAGRHSLGRPAPLKRAVHGWLRARAARNGWSLHAQGQSRVLVVFDAKRAPTSLPGSVGLLEVLFLLLLLAGLWATWPPLAILLGLGLMGWFVRGRRR